MPLISLSSFVARCERGFTSFTLMGVILVGMLFVGSVYAAVDPDTMFSRKDQDNKQSYGAAESGIQYYMHHLGLDGAFFVKCTNVPPPNGTEQTPINQKWNGSGADPRVWRKLPGDKAEYTVELLPAPGYTSCEEGVQESVVDVDGNVRIRATGRAAGQTRSVVATLRRKGFIDFLYFTHFETLDPLAYSSETMRNWASTNCAKFREQRSGCTEIQFGGSDKVLGPFHTNDSILVCGQPVFGRTKRDSIEVNGAQDHYDACSGANPTWDGTKVFPGGQLDMPPSNVGLKTIAGTDYTFTGKTTIELQNDSFTVTNAAFGTKTMTMPPKGVIYVSNSTGSCPSVYQREQQYNASSACGDVWVKGTYNKNLTIAADNDVIINGNVERAADGLLLGLIANNFVRVYHPVNWDIDVDCDDDDEDCTTTLTCTGNATGALSNPVIEAAILALNHSFLVDNWYCGANLGNLTVEGAIAQKYRGPVGTSGGTGYIKNYIYNDRLRFREPPSFLDPVQSAWRIARQNEQVPATR
jgi:hypothetical protein